MEQSYSFQYLIWTTNKTVTRSRQLAIFSYEVAIRSQLQIVYCYAAQKYDSRLTATANSIPIDCKYHVPFSY